MTREQEINQAARDVAFNWNVGRGNEFFYRLDRLAAMARWADEHPKNPWRNLKDEMPPVKQRVLFLDTNGKPRLGYNNIDQKSATVGADSPNEKVTLQYWMPIPEAPKGGER